MVQFLPNTSNVDCMFMWLLPYLKVLFCKSKYIYEYFDVLCINAAFYHILLTPFLEKRSIRKAMCPSISSEFNKASNKLFN